MGKYIQNLLSLDPLRGFRMQYNVKKQNKTLYERKGELTVHTAQTEE